jgi:hypothetical protein
MDGNASVSDGYTWSGKLEETDIRALYAACQTLRFSGRLELTDGPTKAEVQFVAGEPVEIDGGDTQRIALWQRGSFRATQSIPNFAGELTPERELEGDLARTKPSSLWAWISEYRLTCEIELVRPGSKAIVSFQNGHAESAQVNGMPELAALARVSSWTDGGFRVRLRPLFAEGVIPVAPPMPEGAPPIDPRQFDVSRSIPMDLKDRPVTPWPQSLAGRPNTLPLGGPPPPLAPSATGSRPVRPLPGTSDSEPVVLHVPKSKAPWIITALSVVAAGGVGALYYFHVPPFSPPPKPIVEAKPEERPPLEREEPKPTEAKPTEAKPTEAKPTEAKPVENVKPEEPKPTEAKPTEAKPAEPVKSEKDKAVDRLVLKGRQLLVEGRAKPALVELRRAEKLRPKDPALKVYEQQALGKLGHAELILDGKGAVTVDGHRFPSPRRVKLSAGPHTVDAGDGESEVTLKRGEKHHVKVARR